MAGESAIRFDRMQAVNANAKALGELHARSWRAAYKGVLPDDYLGNAAKADRAEHWRRAVASMRARDMLLTASAGDRLAGFLFAQHRPEAGFDIFLDTLLVDPSMRSSGIGTSLLQRLAGEIAKDKRKGLYLWVIDGNASADAFYRSLGAEPADRGISVMLGGEVPQTRLVWPDPVILARRCGERLADPAKRRRRDS